MKVLRIATVSAAALLLSSSLVLAQVTPEPGTDAGKAPTASSSTTHKGKKGGKKKSGKKKGGKKTATTEPAK